jgi:hypothetical protein
MKILVDKEGADIVTQLLDIALKHLGLKSIDSVNEVRKNVQIIQGEVEKDEETKK